MKLEELSVRALHRLEFANSRLRHSVVEECFYNLRVLAQELPGREPNEEFSRNLEETLQNVERAARLIEGHFDYRVAPGLTVSDLFPEKHRAIDQAVDRIDQMAAAGVPDPRDRGACERFSAETVDCVDRVLSEIDELKEKIDRLKVPVDELLEELASIHRPECEAAGVTLEIEDGRDCRLRVLADRGSLLNALGELVRNALRHGFDPGQGGRVALRMEADSRTRDTVISVCDDGRGIAEERLEMIGVAGASTSGGGDGIGMVRQIVEGQHFGVVSYESGPGEGTCARVRLPRRCEPALQEQAESPPPARAAGAGAGRKALAMVVVLVMVGIGVALAWYSIEWQKRSAGPPRGAAERGQETGQSRETPAARETVVIEVAADGSGDYSDLKEALEAAEAGSTIRLAAGSYTGPLALDGNVRIVGDPEEPPEIRSTRGPVVLNTAPEATLENLRLALAASIRSAAVYVDGGKLTLRGCRISSDGLSAVEVAGGEVAVAGGEITGSSRSGIFIYGGASGSVENVRISDCGGSGVAVSEGAELACREVIVERCARGGICVYEGGRGTFEDVDVSGCDAAGVITRDGGDPTVRQSEIHGNRGDGVLVMSDGKGTFQRNRIYGNTGNGIVIHAGGAPRFEENRVEGNGERGLWAEKGALGVLLDNVFSANDQYNRIEDRSGLRLEGNTHEPR